MFGWFRESKEEEKPTIQYTFTHFRRLYNSLQQYHNGSSKNPAKIVETLRLLSEFLVYGDQNQHTMGEAAFFFDFFCEKNMLGLIVEIAKVRNPPVSVQIQVLQSLSILLQNISSTTTLYYLLSNDYVNELIQCPFDTQQEEVRDWYITFLKALSLRLNKQTVQFFFNQHNGTFPLYSEALRFVKNAEPMVRIAVRTLTLSVYRVEDESMRHFICAEENLQYFDQLISVGRALVTRIQKILDKGKLEDQEQLQTLLDEFLDYQYYLQDVFDIGAQELSFKLAERVFTELYYGLFVASILPNCYAATVERVSSLLALSLLGRVFLTITYAPLLTALAYILFHPESDEVVCYGIASMAMDGTKIDTTNSRADALIKYRPHDEACNNAPQCHFRRSHPFADWSPEDALKVQSSGNVYRNALMCLLESANDNLSFAAMYAVACALNNCNVDSAILKEAELLPQRRHRIRRLLRKLTVAEETVASKPLFPTASSEEEEDDSDEERDRAQSDTLIETKGAEQRQRAESLAERKYCNATLERLLLVLSREPGPRTVNIQIAARLILDLVVDDRTSSPYLLPDHAAKFQRIHSHSAKMVLQHVNDDRRRDGIVSLMRQEVHQAEKEAFPLKLDQFIINPLYFMRTSHFPPATVPLEFRSAKDDTEACRRAIQVFWILSKLRIALIGKETILPLDGLDFQSTLAQEFVGSLLTLRDSTHFICTWRGSGPSKHGVVVLDENVFYLATATKQENRAQVCLASTIDQLYAVLDRNDKRILHLSISSENYIDGAMKAPHYDPVKNPLWHITTVYEQPEEAIQIKHHLDITRTRIHAQQLSSITDRLQCFVSLEKRPDEGRRDN